ncbi:hypothetical protein BGW38_008125, partial [Lunasporangiospora selenospora]
RLAHYVQGEYDRDLAMNNAEYIAGLAEPQHSQVVTAHGDAQKILSIILASLVISVISTLMMKKVDLSLDHDAQDAKFGSSSKEDIELSDDKIETEVIEKK